MNFSTTSPLSSIPTTLELSAANVLLEQVSMSVASITAKSALPIGEPSVKGTSPPPVSNKRVFPALGNPADDGDSMLDELLDLDMPGSESAALGGRAGGLSWGGSESGPAISADTTDFVNKTDGQPRDRGDHGYGSIMPKAGIARAHDAQESISSVGAVRAAAWQSKGHLFGGAAAHQSAPEDKENDASDSLLDALLDLNLSSAGPTDVPNPVVRAEGNAGTQNTTSTSTVVEVTASRIPRRGGTEPDEGSDGEKTELTDLAEASTAEASMAEASPPFGGAELGHLCTHLNNRNRKAKRLAQQCQDMFLRLYFKVHMCWRSA